MYSSLFFLRLAVGIVFMVHATPKLQDPKKMSESMRWTAGQVLGLGIIEFMSAVALISGVATRGAAFALVLVMVGSIYHKVKKWDVPFMAHDKTGWELDFLLLASAFTIYLK